MLGGAVQLKQHAIVLDTDDGAWQRLNQIPAEARRIDIWWFDDESSRLSLLLAHLMTRTEEWADARLQVIAPTSSEGEPKAARSRLEKRLSDYRIDASIEATPAPELADVVRLSRDAALVFLPLRIEGMQLQDPFGFGLQATLTPLPLVALVAACQDVRLSEERPEKEAPETPEDEGRRAP